MNLAQRCFNGRCQVSRFKGGNRYRDIIRPDNTFNQEICPGKNLTKFIIGSHDLIGFSRDLRHEDVAARGDPGRVPLRVTIG